MSRRNLPKHRPPTHPGEMLLEESLKPLGISQAEFAKRVRVSYVRLNAVINGRRGVTCNTALRLEQTTGMDAGFWLGLSDRLGSLTSASLLSTIASTFSTSALVAWRSSGKRVATKSKS